VAKVFWTDKARTVLGELDPRAQDEIRRQLRFVERWPEMFALLTEHPRWHEHRKIAIFRRWLVLYRVSYPSAGDPQVYIADIVPARSNF
jgi:hypothetical protein